MNKNGPDQIHKTILVIDILNDLLPSITAAYVQSVRKLNIQFIMKGGISNFYSLRISKTELVKCHTKVHKQTCNMIVGL